MTSVYLSEALNTEQCRAKRGVRLHLALIGSCQHLSPSPLAVDVADNKELSIMDTTQGYLFKAFALAGPAAYWFPAPFGRYSLSSDSWFVFDGKAAWMVQEIVAPLILIYRLLQHDESVVMQFSRWQYMIITLFLGHYINRSLIWPIFMMPSISPSHL